MKEIVSNIAADFSYVERDNLYERLEAAQTEFLRCWANSNGYENATDEELNQGYEEAEAVWADLYSEMISNTSG